MSDGEPGGDFWAFFIKERKMLQCGGTRLALRLVNEHARFDFSETAASELFGAEKPTARSNQERLCERGMKKRLRSEGEGMLFFRNPRRSIFPRAPIG